MSPLQAAWFIAAHDVRTMLRQRETLVWVFVMPFVFFYFIGTVTGGSGGGGDSVERLALRSEGQAGFLMDQLERRLGERNYEVVRFDGGQNEEFEQFSRRIEVPGGFTDEVLAGNVVELSFTGEREGLGGDYDDMRVGRAVYTLLADLVAASELGGTVTPERLAELADAPRALQLAVSTAGRRVEIPSGFEQTVPGTMVMFTLIVLLTAGAVLLVIERREGLLRRLASAPIGRGELVLGKWAGRLALGLVQLGFAVLIGRFIFGVHWGGSAWPMVGAILFAWAALCASLGILLGSLARTEGQAVGIGVLSANVLAALGGCWWPIEITPGWMQSLALFLPTGVTMDALHQLMSFESGAASALPHLIVLALAALAVGWCAARVFKYQ